MKAVVDAGVPILVLVAMVVVGMELTIDDFRRVARQPRVIALATLGQFIFLPAIGWLLVRCCNLQAGIAQGVLLVVACPSGAMANVYTYMGRGNLALSVTLTAVSCLAAVLGTPLALALLQSQDGAIGFQVPLGVLVGQLLVLLVLPVLFGMGIRHRWPGIAGRHRRSLLGFSIIALAALLGLVIAQEAEHFASSLTEIAFATAMLTVLAFATGWATGWAARAARLDRFTIGMVFVVRNVGIATAIAVTTLGRVEFAVFATAYFLAQVPMLLAATLVFRGMWASNESKFLEVECP